MENFMKRVLAVQTALKAPKNQRNTYGGYNYRSCEDILEAVKPICKAQNVLLTLTDDLCMVGDRYYIKATATLRDTDSTETIAVTAYAREAESKKGMDDSQVSGTASSYARKYALNGLLCVDDTKDADTDEYAKQVKNDPVQAKKEEPAPKKTEPPNVQKFTCAECGKDLKPYISTDGKEIGVRHHAAGSEKRFGKVLCLDCIAKMYPDAVRK